MAGRGPGNWHPAPFFFYRKGAGPLFDIGPYPITALLHLLGPVARVAGMARRSADERPITEGDLKGQVIPIDVETHVAATLEFVSGTVMTLIQSFDIHAHSLPRLEIYGEAGALQVPDPNGFRDEVRWCPGERKGWEDIEALPGYCNAKHRGLGAADMGFAIANDRPHRASGELGYHVLDVMSAIIESSDQGRVVETESTCDRPEPLATDLVDGKLVS
jgi:predicted dehydrogenase